MKTYKFLVSLCGGWCNGFLEINAESEDVAYEKAMDFVSDNLATIFPTLDINYNIECYNPDDECIVKCKDCGKEIEECDASYLQFENGNDYICNDCLEKYGFCEVCSTYYDTTKDDVEIYGLRGGTICSNCYDENGFRYE